MSQRTLEETGLRQTKCKAYRKVSDSGSGTSFSEHLQEDIRAAIKRKRESFDGSVCVEDEETDRFLKKAKICCLSVKNDDAKTRAQRYTMPLGERLVTNETTNEVVYKFASSFKDTTTAQFTTKKGFKIGVGALLGGGAGAQGGVGIAAQYVRGVECAEKVAHETGKQMELQVTVAAGESAKIVETAERKVYDAECEFDIAIEKSYKIRYSVDGGKKFIKAKHLKRKGDPDDDSKKHKKNDVVHLRRNCRCELVNEQHKLAAVELNKDSESDTSTSDSETDSDSVNSYDPDPTHLISYGTNL